MQTTVIQIKKMHKLILVSLTLFSLTTHAQDTIRIKLPGTSTFASGYWSLSGNNIFNNNFGNVGIGTTDTKGYKLAVNGDAIFNRVKVKPYANWPDYVFGNDYQLPSLKDIETFIRTNNHLPDVPSALEVEKNGIDLGDNQTILLRKLEELTLYIIEQDKKAEQLQQRLNELQQEINELKSGAKKGN